MADDSVLLVAAMVLAVAEGVHHPWQHPVAAS